MLQYATLYSSMLQYATICYNMLQYATVCYSILQYATVWYCYSSRKERFKVWQIVTPEPFA